MRIGKTQARFAILVGSFVVLIVLFASPVAVSADDTASAKAAYKTKCAICHAPDGSGQTPTGKALKIPDLRSEEVQKKSDADLAKVIADGKDNMPSFKENTTDEQIRALVAYIRELAGKKSAPSK